MPKLYLDPEDDLTGHVDSSFDMPSVERAEGPYLYTCDACENGAHDHCRQFSIFYSEGRCKCARCNKGKP